MNYKIEISISALMILFVLFELIKINIFKKDNDALPTALVSMLLLGFGMYLLIKYGLILDYGTAIDPKAAHAELVTYFAIASVFTGLGFIVISILKFVFWKIKKIDK